MVTVTIDEAYAFDMLSILQVKLNEFIDENKRKSIEENYRIFCCTETKNNKQIIKEEFECARNESWDSEMMCYPTVFEVEKQRYMYYNGNNYGETGIGLAKWV